MQLQTACKVSNNNLQTSNETSIISSGQNQAKQGRVNRRRRLAARSNKRAKSLPISFSTRNKDELFMELYDAIFEAKLMQDAVDGEKALSLHRLVIEKASI